MGRQAGMVGLLAAIMMYSFADSNSLVLNSI